MGMDISISIGMGKNLSPPLLKIRARSDKPPTLFVVAPEDSASLSPLGQTCCIEAAVSAREAANQPKNQTALKTSPREEEPTPAKWRMQWRMQWHRQWHRQWRMRLRCNSAEIQLGPAAAGWTKQAMAAWRVQLLGESMRKPTGVQVPAGPGWQPASCLQPWQRA